MLDKVPPTSVNKTEKSKLPESDQSTASNFLGCLSTLCFPMEWPDSREDLLSLSEHCLDQDSWDQPSVELLFRTTSNTNVVLRNEADHRIYAFASGQIISDVAATLLTISIQPDRQTPETIKKLYKSLSKELAARGAQFLIADIPTDEPLSRSIEEFPSNDLLFRDKFEGPGPRSFSVFQLPKHPAQAFCIKPPATSREIQAATTAKSLVKPSFSIYQRHQWHTIGGELFGVHKAAFQQKSWSIDTFIEQLHDPSAIAIIGTDLSTNKIIAVSIVHTRSPLLAHTLMTAVHPAYQGQGVVAKMKKIIDGVLFNSGYRFSLMECIEQNEYASKIDRSYNSRIRHSVPFSSGTFGKQRAFLVSLSQY